MRHETGALCDARLQIYLRRLAHRCGSPTSSDRQSCCGVGWPVARRISFQFLTVLLSCSFLRSVNHEKHWTILGGAVVIAVALFFGFRSMKGDKATRGATHTRLDIEEEAEIPFNALTDAEIGLLYQQGKYSEAVEIAKEALEIVEEAFGPDPVHMDSLGAAKMSALLDRKIESIID